jgi:hypothetical protein
MIHNTHLFTCCFVSHMFGYCFYLFSDIVNIFIYPLPHHVLRVDIVKIPYIRNEIGLMSIFILLSLFIYKKFWEELIAYFPLIRHGPHRKRIRCLATIMGLLPSRCLATIGEIHRHKHTQTHTHGQQRDLISLLYFSK